MSTSQYYLIFAVVLVSSLSANPIEPEIPDESGAPREVVFVNVVSTFYYFLTFFNTKLEVSSPTSYFQILNQAPQICWRYTILTSHLHFQVPWMLLFIQLYITTTELVGYNEIFLQQS